MLNNVKRRFLISELNGWYLNNSKIEMSIWWASDPDVAGWLRLDCTSFFMNPFFASFLFFSFFYSIAFLYSIWLTYKSVLRKVLFFCLSFCACFSFSFSYKICMLSLLPILCPTGFCCVCVCVCVCGSVYTCNRGQASGFLHANVDLCQPWTSSYFRGGPLDCWSYKNAFKTVLYI